MVMNFLLPRSNDRNPLPPPQTLPPAQQAPINLIFRFVVIVPITIFVGQVGLVVVEHHTAIQNLLGLVHALHQVHKRPGCIALPHHIHIHIAVAHQFEGIGNKGDRRVSSTLSEGMKAVCYDVGSLTVGFSVGSNCGTIPRSGPRLRERGWQV
jgi:hypothetical protein